MTEILKIEPAEIERKSFEIISEELGEQHIDPEKEPIIKRVIHTTADFEYANTLYFSPGVVELAQDALREGAHIVTDTQMAKAGINKKTATKLGCEVDCFISEESVVAEAKKNKTTRASAAVDKSVKEIENLVYVVGNAPTALIRLRELIDQGKAKPKLIVAVPVGFVNVVAAKELIIESDIPCIVAKGRKGGSNVAACIINALLYMIDNTRGETGL